MLMLLMELDIFIILTIYEMAMFYTSGVQVSLFPSNKTLNQDLPIFI